MGLYAASALITFLLQTSTEWGVCLLLVRIARSPRMRFRLWLALFVTIFLQWAWLLSDVVRRFFLTDESTASQTPTAPAAGHTLVLAPNWESRAAMLLIAFAACYGVILCGLILRALWSRFRLKKALNFKITPSPRLSHIFQEVSLFTPSRGCQLWVLPGLTSPATFGWWRPQIIVPLECENQNACDLEAVFWHELTHIQRRDALWNAFVRGCRNLLWFHPCMHHACSAIGIERELACDRVVVEDFPVDRDSYASCLLRFARLGISSAKSPCIELASGTAFLDLRVRSILMEAPQTSFVSTLRRTVASFAILAAMSVFAPCLSILLTIARTTQPLASLRNLPVHAATTNPSARWNHGKQKASPPPANLPLSKGNTAAYANLAKDPQLAASHRVGMDVLTRYSDSREAQSDERASDRGSLTLPAHTTTQPSWTTIAVGAAERLNNIDFDHDHDRR